MEKEKCPVCLEEISNNICKIEICLVCSNIICVKCLNPEYSSCLELCPCCRSSLKDDVENRSLALLEKTKDRKKISIIYKVLYKFYNDKNDSVNYLKYLNLAIKEKVPCAFLDIYLNGINFGEENVGILEYAFNSGCLNSCYYKAKKEQEKGNNDYYITLLKKGSDAGCTKSQIDLTSYYLKNNRLEEGIEILQKLANKGDAEAYFRLSNYYQEENDIEKAVSYATEAAIKDHPLAQYNLGIYYKLIDVFESTVWFKKSYTNGIDMAGPELAENILILSKFLGDFMEKEAIKILEEISDIEINNTKGENNYKLAMLYQKEKNQEKYLESLIKSINSNCPSIEGAKALVKESYFNNRKIDKEIVCKCVELLN